MTWSSSPVDGQQSVAANKTPINNAFGYLDTNLKVDHFWDNNNANLDGHHQFAQMPKFESGGSPANPSRATDMDGVYFVKDKTASDAPDLQMAEPHYIANDGTNDQVLQLGFRALVHFETNGTIKYSHNVTSVTRNSTGKYTITFGTDMPTANYLVVGGGIRSSSSDRVMTMSVQSATSFSSVQTQSSVKVLFQGNKSGDKRDPVRGWVAIIGG